MQQNKSAAEIQRDIRLMRLAYRRRQDTSEVSFMPTFRGAKPYLIAGSVLAASIAFLIAVFIS